MQNQATGIDRSKLEQRIKSSANWFFWIAALSVINSVVQHSGGNVNFVIGLGITHVIDAIAGDSSNAGKGIALTFDVMVAAVFALFGYFAHKRHQWAFLIGGILYAIDTLLYVALKDFIGIAFHVLAVISIFAGFNANRKLQHTEQQMIPIPAPITNEPIV
jgi:hypothetical protein